MNPLERGHIAYRTEDLKAFKAHLKKNGVAFSDWDETAVAGWQQIFFYDPDGNVIEVHQINSIHYHKVGKHAEYKHHIY